MITICIPIYNFDVSSLVQKLSEQITQVNAEIIIIDDCSFPKYLILNEKICSQHTYIKLPINVGRSKIRNQFLKHSKFEHLLFLDCDSKINSKKYISNYINFIENNKYDVIFGGRVYPNDCSNRNYMLSWKYGVLTESKSAKTRGLNSYKSFMSNNFLITKKVFNKVKFDERLTKYGHEDTLFSYTIKNNGLQITHIENPVLNGDIEDNTTFLRKTEIGISNLHLILENQKSNDFFKHIALIHFYERIKAKKLENIAYYIFTLCKPILRFTLVKGYINLKLFSFYKLGLFIEQKKDVH